MTRDNNYDINTHTHMCLTTSSLTVHQHAQSPAELTNLDNRTVHVLLLLLPFFELSHIPCITSLKIMTGKSGVARTGYHTHRRRW